MTSLKFLDENAATSSDSVSQRNYLFAKILRRERSLVGASSWSGHSTYNKSIDLTAKLWVHVLNTLDDVDEVSFKPTLLRFETIEFF